MKFATNLPIYTQIIDWVKDQVINGNYPPGYQLPSRRQLASEWKVNPNTVQKALKEMEELGMINTQAQKPSTITTNLDLINQLKIERMDQAIESLIDVLVPMNLSLEEVIERIRSHYQEKTRSEDND